MCPGVCGGGGGVVVKVKCFNAYGWELCFFFLVQNFVLTQVRLVKV